ncbi:unnamed protein product [Knipowitschia caucasica]
MDDPDSGTVRARNTAAVSGDSKRELLSTKPLHRFVQKEPRSLGIVILMFGCAEFLIGLLMSAHKDNSTFFYTPFWLGALFNICGILSIYTGTHPSKKMVTVCLSMYVVSLIGILVSFGLRLTSLSMLSYYRNRHARHESIRASMMLSLESLLLTSSLFVFGLLIFLCVVARLALKSTRTQIVLHQIPAAATETPTE